MEEDSNFTIELACLTSNIKNKVCGVLNFFNKKIWRENDHNMFSLILNPKFKSFHLVSSFINRE
jgi:type IV secretory pathway VirB3-like protein